MRLRLAACCLLLSTRSACPNFAVLICKLLLLLRSKSTEIGPMKISADAEALGCKVGTLRE